jgi:hypothetical protein
MRLKEGSLGTAILLLNKMARSSIERAIWKPNRFYITAGLIPQVHRHDDVNKAVFTNRA